MRRFFAVLLAVVVLAVLGFAGATAHFVRQIRTFEPVTLDAPFSDSALAAEFELNGGRTPAAFGFPRYREERFVTEPEGLTLRGWFVPAADTASRRAVVFVHGRGSNRLKPMKYLPLLRQAGLDAGYHVFLPDLRNAGLSDPGPTAMGWAYAEDVLSTLEHLHRQHGVDTAIVYAFSMGAMAMALAQGDPALRRRLAASGVGLGCMVFDSPLPDVRGVIENRGAQDGIPTPLVASALWGFDQTIGGRLDDMRLDVLLDTVAAPTLILHGTADAATPYALLAGQRATMSRAVEVDTFAGATHVHLFTNPAHGPAYRDRVVRFLQERCGSR